MDNEKLEQAKPTKHILVIGIKSTVLVAYRTRLMRLGFDIDECGFHENYVHMLSTRHYEAVITSIVDPRTGSEEGLKVIRLVREWHPGTKVLIISSNGSTIEKELALKSGAAYYLAAPVFVPDVFKALRVLEIIHDDNEANR